MDNIEDKTQNISDIQNKLLLFDDSNFYFDTSIRKYSYNNKPLISVTNFTKKFFTEFDSDYWSKVKAKERGVTPEEILAEWDAKAKRSTEIGNNIHKWIENYYNKVWTEIPNDIEIIGRINSFNRCYVSHLSKLTPIAFEKKVFSEELGIMGVIDSIYEHNGGIILIDFKTNEKIKKDNKYQKMLGPFSKYDDCDFMKYSMQLSLYKLLLRKIGLKVKACYILHLYSDITLNNKTNLIDGGFEMIKILDMSDMLENYFKDLLTSS